MKPFETHGAFSWSELQTTDPAGAAQFYAAVYGWEIQTMDMDMGPYSVANVGGEPVAGIMNRVSEEVPVHWGFYVTVDDVDATMKAAQAAGCTVLMEAFDAPTVGRIGVFMDPQGAVLNVIKYLDPGNEAHGRDFLEGFTTHGCPSWFEIRVPDANAAAALYGDLFGWNVEFMDTPTGRYGVINIGEVGIGGMLAVTPDEMPPHWGAYVTVDDLDAYVAAAGEAGGQIVIPPVDVPNTGRFAMVSDPQGGVIAGFEYLPMHGMDA